jgi:predicted nuclease with TOPRIM domain
MFYQNTESLLANLIQKADINTLNQVVTMRLLGEVCEHNYRISALEQKHEEILLKLDNFENQLQEKQESMSVLEAEIPHLIRHLTCKNEDLENRLAFLEPQD